MVNNVWLEFNDMIIGFILIALLWILGIIYACLVINGDL
nr:MAG TPA: hypothetical protein [Caudoviricetes sp.]